MKRIIVVEGPDNVGKSYLVKQLAEKFTSFKSVVRHFGPPKARGDAALREQLRLLDDMVGTILDGNGLEIWDRSVFGEMVYGPLYRTGQYDHLEYTAAINKALNRIRQQLYIVALYTDGEVFRRLKVKAKGDEKEIYQKKEHAKTIATTFVNVLSALGVKRTLLVNCRNYASFDERNKYVIKRTRLWINREIYTHPVTHDYRHTFFNPHEMLWDPSIGFISNQYLCRQYDNASCPIGVEHEDGCAFGEQYGRPTNGCGANRNVKYVFVGEAPGYNGCGKTGIPFYDDLSGNLMQTTLDRLGILPVHYYMTNVVKCCPEKNELSKHVNNNTRRELTCVRSLTDELTPVLNKTTVIALGKVAAFELARLKIDHVMTYHPAYHLRMGTPELFYNELKTAIGG